MVQIGDKAQCPKCRNMCRVVWVSQDEKLAGIQCPGSHSQLMRGHSKYGSQAWHQSKLEKNMVFLTEIEGSTAILRK